MYSWYPLHDGKWYFNDQVVLDVIDTTLDGVEWYLNETKELTYLSACTSDSTCIDVYSDTCTSTILGDSDEIEGGNALWSAIGEFLPSRAPVKTSFLSEDQVYDVVDSFFKVPACKEGQKPMLIWEFETTLCWMTWDSWMY